jgi:hypothetical protein
MLRLSLVLLSFVMGAQALAGTRVCAGKTTHYSFDQADFGAAPPVGTPIGEEFISLKGVLLGKRELRFAESPVGQWELTLDFQNRANLAGGGSQVSGWTVFSAELTVLPTNAYVKRPLAQELVTCRETWAMVP